MQLKMKISQQYNFNIMIRMNTKLNYQIIQNKIFNQNMNALNQTINKMKQKYQFYLKFNLSKIIKKRRLYQ